MKEPDGTSKPRIPGWAKTLSAVLVSALIIYYYFYNQDWGKLYQAAKQANLTLAILAVLIQQLIWWFFEVYITERHFKWFHNPFPWKTYTWVRGAMYFLELVNFTLAGGGVLLYLRRKTNITWKKLLGMMLFRVGLSLWGFTLFTIPMTMAMHYYGIFEKTKLNPYIWWGGIIMSVLWLIQAWLKWHYDKSYGISRLTVRDKDSEFWTVFRMADKKQWLLTILWGVIPMVAMAICYWFFALAFGVKIPILHYATTAILVIMLADLPIAFAGFGTTTMAWMIFYGDFGTRESIACLTLFMPFVRAVIRVMIGLLALKPAFQDINSLIQTSDTDESMPKEQGIEAEL